MGPAGADERESNPPRSIVTETPTSIAQPSHPPMLCGYPVVEALSPGVSYLAIGPGGRGVVLKKLDPDCLHGALLHPDVRDRLSRVRELAHVGVANFFGVGKEGADAWLIWEYVEGKPFGDAAAARRDSPHELAALLRELVLTVDSLHVRGIVHGSIHSRNVIVTPEGSIRLTDVSPLLYVDPADDAEGVDGMIGPILAEVGEKGGPLAQLVAEARESNAPLRTLAAGLAVLIEAREGTVPPAETPARVERRTRRRTILAAAFVALAGVAVAYGVWQAVK